MEPTSFGTVLVGPNALLREGLKHILSAGHFRVLVSAPISDVPILSSLPLDLPLLLIIEVSSDFRTTLNQIECFKERYPAARIALLAHPHQLPQLPDLALAFRAGANAYFLNVATSDVFMKSLELVMLGETILPAAILPFLGGKEGAFDNGNDCNLNEDRSTHLNYVKDGDCADDNQERNYDSPDSIAEALLEIEDNHVPSLSARQKFILNCLIEGDSNKTIARKIHITEATVKVHLKAILRKIRVQNRTQAAIWAMNNGSSICAEENGSYHLAEISDRAIS
jgi:two-component system, NarL family, nitrate/nitrite response regulator NarL